MRGICYNWERLVEMMVVKSQPWIANGIDLYSRPVLRAHKAVVRMLWCTAGWEEDHVGPFFEARHTDGDLAGGVEGDYIAGAAALTGSEEASVDAAVYEVEVVPGDPGHGSRH